MLQAWFDLLEMFGLNDYPTTWLECVPYGMKFLLAVLVIGSVMMMIWQLIKTSWRKR